MLEIEAGWDVDDSIKVECPCSMIIADTMFDQKVNNKKQRNIFNILNALDSYK